MGKSSSSRKKRSKYSSLDRGRKRSKTKRAKPRKHKRYDDSDSESYSTDDSRSLTSVSVSSEDSYRGRKSRSSIRKEKTKRRARSLSTSSDESFRSRKKKGSRRKFDSQARKKVVKHKKKRKSKRDASISSRSCSTCESSSDESEYESRHRGRSERRKSDVKSSKSKKRKYRSRSCSSCSRDSDGDYWREEKVTDGNISKRLKSIITVAYNDDEKETGEYKEEIVYEDDSYPSSRSNDSDGARNKRSTENKESEDLLEGKPTCDELVMKDSFGEKIDEIAEAGGGDANEDLETLLRQKALENLKRFRGQKQVNSDGKKDESPDLSRNDLKNSCNLGNERDSDHSLQEEKILDGKNGSDEPTSKVAAAMIEKEKESQTSGHEVSTQRIVSSALKQALSNSVPKVKSVNNVNSETGKTKCDDGGLQGEDKESSGMEQRSLETTASNVSGPNAAAQDMKSREGEAEAKESSQLEKKTMSVMRGGELVEVSYKVYIPNKAPALTRRQLKR